LVCTKATFMKIKFLFPYKCKKIGWLISVPTFIFMLVQMNTDFTFGFLNYQASSTTKISGDHEFLFNLQSHNFTADLTGLLLIGSLLLLAFSKEKYEDERILKIRLESLVWAVYVNSVLLMLAIIFFYDMLFLNVMVYNICTTLILFIARFNLVMFFDRRNAKMENL